MWLANTVKGALIASQLRLIGLPQQQNQQNQPGALSFGGLLAITPTLYQQQQGLAFINEENSQPLLIIAKDGLHSQVPIIAQSLDVNGPILINSIPQWRLVREERFQSLKSEGWTMSAAEKTSAAVTECAGIPLLGGYSVFSKGEIAKHFTELPSHDYLRIRATFHFIDNWTGESAFMRASIGKDGSMVHVWTDRHTQDSGDPNAINVCGSSVPEGKFSTPIDVTFPHTSDSITVGFGSTIDTDDATDRSWGISAIELYVR